MPPFILSFQQEELLRLLFDEAGLELVALVAGHVKERPFKWVA